MNWVEVQLLTAISYIEIYSTCNDSLPDTLSVSLTVAVMLVTVFSAWQLMNSSEMWLFTVMSMELPGTVFPYRIHVKLQEGMHSAEHVKLAVTPISRESGPEMTTFVGPSVNEEKSKQQHENQGFFFPWSLTFLNLENKLKLYKIYFHVNNMNQTYLLYSKMYQFAKKVVSC